MSEFCLESYLTKGVENIVKSIIKAASKNPTSSLYMIKYASINKKAAKFRKNEEEKGNHIPPFLIASITTKCNLHCKGCYARANHSCFDGELNNMPEQLTAKQWAKIFEQAGEIGISFVLLAGGEPLIRNDVILEAAKQKKILFPIFTNGTMINDNNIDMFILNPNLLPVLSIEGNKKTTDTRRGNGVFDNLLNTMLFLKEKGITYGASVTVQNNNMKEVMGDEFLTNLQKNGCKAVIYVEYVPIDEATKGLAPTDEEREWMMSRLNDVRDKYQDILFVAFPGDEKTSGGCLAAGRGFFHINAYGGAEPCPFSPYSDTNLKDTALIDALNSPLFKSLQQSGALLEEHVGGCVLFEQKEKVKGFVS